ncbi:hypothetical protein LCGC14_0463660 [marine sediment metagenome]|uniref:Uncharacterized protein n=1 Tax=marine sediment metagenome TaxID=412755 RepID=A0A0F9VN14_9ZZZZ
MGFCNDITPTCDVCFEFSYGKCNDVLTFSLGLPPNTVFFLNLIDKFDIVTQLTVLTDASGEFTITQTWTEFFGAVEIQIFTDATRENLVPFVIGSTSFDCIVATAGGITASPVICPELLDFSFACDSQYLIL